MPPARPGIVPLVMLEKIIAYLETELRHAEVTDYPGAHNGLQVENSGRVERVCAAVDACEAVLTEAARVPGTLLLVHHGLLWSGAQPFTGAVRRKLKLAFDADLAVFSSHLPLDLHPTLGNNALLVKLLKLRKVQSAFAAKGQKIGFVGETTGTREALVRKLEEALDGRVHVAPGGPAKVRRLGICSGGSGSEVAQAAALGCDTFLCGEGPHHTYTLAEELGVNLLYAGHYATETLGVRALAETVGKKFRKPWSFIDHPTGL
jgi:dinuclear metal center YbgI/SA1388 family protein